MAPFHVDTGDCEASVPFIDRDSSSPCQHECCSRPTSDKSWYPHQIDQHKSKTYWLTYINIVVFLVLVITWIQIGREPSSCPPTSSREALKLTSQWSPIFDEVDLTPQATVIDGRLYSPSNISVYRGEPSSQTDAAWDDLASEAYEVILVDAETLRRAGYNPDHYFKAPESWSSLQGRRANGASEEDLFPVQIDVFHQIHCLNAVRKQMHSQYYFPESSEKRPDEMHWMHMRHCLHMVLQSLTCSADVDIVPHRWVEEDEVPFAQFGVTKKCRNFDNLRRWNRDNAVKDVRAVWPHDKKAMPAQAFVWPGHGEPERESSYP
ncbi:hypothetical protein diail_9822 [Diaporthe ilicicola]|nr:hypothetical protein diail_9822 [Diaporthe ilicicola]